MSYERLKFGILRLLRRPTREINVALLARELHLVGMHCNDVGLDQLLQPRFAGSR